LEEALEGGPWRAVDQLKVQTCFVSPVQPRVQSKHTTGSMPRPDHKVMLVHSARSPAQQGEPAGLMLLPTAIAGAAGPSLSGANPAQTRKGGISSPGDTRGDQARRKKPLKILPMGAFRRCPLP